MKKVFVLVMTLGLVIIMAGAGFTAWFSDTETGTGNSFTAGTLDLTVDGKNGQNVNMTYENMRPGTQTNRTFRVKNIGSIPGYLDLESIGLQNLENDCWEPETQFGDQTCGAGGDQGELQTVFAMRVMHDVDCDGWYGTGDKILFDSKFGNIPALLDADVALAANGGEACINFLGNWWSTANDNLAQSDKTIMDLTFSLEQQAD